MEHVRALRRFACFVAAAAAIAAAITLASPAHARGHHHHRHHRVNVCDTAARYDAMAKGVDCFTPRRDRHAHAGNTSGDPRPAAWCGWWLRHYLGIADKTLNLAIAWARIGQPASGPCVGCVAVWPHHVGIVTSVPGPGRIVLKSGNDGHAVRERERSSAGVVAWRVVGHGETVKVGAAHFASAKGERLHHAQRSAPPANQSAGSW